MALMTNDDITTTRAADAERAIVSHRRPLRPADGAAVSTALRFRPDPAAWLAELERPPRSCRGGERGVGAAGTVGDVAPPIASGVVRLVVSIALVIAMALAWNVAGWLAGPGSGVDPVGAQTTPEAQTVVIVQPGDTLWSIAADVDPDGNIRATVDRLAERNGGSALTIGQRLIVAG